MNRTSTLESTICLQLKSYTSEINVMFSWATIVCTYGYEFDCGCNIKRIASSSLDQFIETLYYKNCIILDNLFKFI